MNSVSGNDQVRLTERKYIKFIIASNLTFVYIFSSASSSESFLFPRPCLPTLSSNTQREKEVFGSRVTQIGVPTYIETTSD